ncbi:hypothetical protein [Alkaliphilus peptidifermentans]|uniref:Outer membrane efflux protein n=1 Tax=Alkaliphilus peptidifermentans DSM 18978 TaxID=1120976 RepID=A0A1G5KQQ2_9FIRM|nr:hypothetical protein [Alkaliphilus peptidifermentans]SCZ03003.1 hypothetical protein SAMN03080606_03698 [Alkaliphilus peptidifermentans DSM 18978]
MKVKSKKLVVFIVISCMLTLFSTSYAQESNAEVEIDKALWNEAIMNVEAAEAEKARAEWELLSQEEKYNKLYMDYTQILMTYYNEFRILKRSISDSSGESISGKCYSLMTKINTMTTEASNLTTESKYQYSKEYLVNSFRSLKKIVNYLDTYDLYIATNDSKSANEVLNNIEEESNIFIEAFGKAYNYYVITQTGEVITSSLNQTEDTFFKKLKENLDVINSSYAMLEEAHGLIKEKKNAAELIKKVEKNNRSVSFLNVKTIENKQTIVKANNILELLKTATEELDYYSFDVMTEGKGNDSKFISTFKELKTEIDDINSDFKAIEAKVDSIADNVSEKVAEIENEDLKKAQENGYSSVEEYNAALKKQEELEHLDKILKEYEKLCEEKEQLQREYQEMLLAIHEQWLNERIDFSNGQNGQNHDKNFYMEKVKEDLADVYSIDSYLASLIYKYQSEAYDEMWKIANKSDANLKLLQQLYDDYPNDFMTIVLLYDIQISFK